MTQADKSRLPVASRFTPYPAAHKMATAYKAMAANPALMAVATAVTPAIMNEARGNEAALVRALSPATRTPPAPPWSSAGDGPFPTAVAFQVFEGPKAETIPLPNLWNNVGIAQLDARDMDRLQHLLTRETMDSLTAEPTPAMLAAFGLPPEADVDQLRDALDQADPAQRAQFLNLVNPLLDPDKNVYIGRKHGGRRIFNPGDPDWHPGGALTPEMLDTLGLDWQMEPDQIHAGLRTATPRQSAALHMTPAMLDTLGLPPDALPAHISKALHDASSPQLQTLIDAVPPSPQSGMWGNPFSEGEILTAAHRLHGVNMSPSEARQITQDLYALYLLNNKYLLQHILAGALEGKTLYVPANAQPDEMQAQADLLSEVAALPPAQLQAFIDNLDPDDGAAAALVARCLSDYLAWTTAPMDAAAIDDFMTNVSLDDMLRRLPQLQNLRAEDVELLRQMSENEARDLIREGFMTNQRARPAPEFRYLPNRKRPDFSKLAPDVSADLAPHGEPSPEAQALMAPDGFLNRLLTEAGHGEGAWLHDQAMPILANVLTDPAVRDLSTDELTGLLHANLYQLARDGGFPTAYTGQAAGWIASESTRAGLLSPSPDALSELPGVENMPKLQQALAVANQERVQNGLAPFGTAHEMLRFMRENDTITHSEWAAALGVETPATIGNWLKRLESHERDLAQETPIIDGLSLSQASLRQIEALRMDASMLAALGLGVDARPKDIKAVLASLSPDQLAALFGSLHGSAPATTVTRLYDHSHDWAVSGLPAEGVLYVGGSGDRLITPAMLAVEMDRVQQLSTADDEAGQALRLEYAAYLSQYPNSTLAHFVRDRMAIWGNPYTEGDVSDQVESYALYVINNAELLQRIVNGELDDKELVCFCNEAHDSITLLDDACHANVLARLANMPRQEVQALLDNLHAADPNDYADRRRMLGIADIDPRDLNLINAAPPWQGETHAQKYGPPEPGTMPTLIGALPLARFLQDGQLLIPEGGVYIDDAASAARYGWDGAGVGKWANPFLDYSPFTLTVNPKPEIVNQMYSLYILNNGPLLDAIVAGELDDALLVGLQPEQSAHANALQRLVAYDRDALRGLATDLKRWAAEHPDDALALRQALESPGIDLTRLAAEGRLPNAMPPDMADDYADLIALSGKKKTVETAAINHAVERSQIIRQDATVLLQQAVLVASHDLDHQEQIPKYDNAGNAIATPQSVRDGVVDIHNSVAYKAYMSKTLNPTRDLRDEVLAIQRETENAAIEGKKLSRDAMRELQRITGDQRVMLVGEACELYETDQRRGRTALQNAKDQDRLQLLIDSPPGQSDNPTEGLNREARLLWHALWTPEALARMPEFGEAETLVARQQVRDMLLRMSDTYATAGYRHSRLNNERLHEYILSDSQLALITDEAGMLAAQDVDAGQMPDFDAAGQFHESAYDPRGNAIRHTDQYKSALSRVLLPNVGRDGFLAPDSARPEADARALAAADLSNPPRFDADGALRGADPAGDALRSTDQYKAALSRLLNPDAGEPGYRRPTDALSTELFKAEAREMGRLDSIGKPPKENSPDRAAWLRKSASYETSRAENSLQMTLLQTEAREMGRLDAIGQPPPDDARARWLRATAAYAAGKADHQFRDDIDSILTADYATLSYKERVIRLLVETGNVTMIRPGEALDHVLAGAKYPLLDPERIGTDAQWITLSVDASARHLLPPGFGSLKNNAPDLEPTMDIIKDMRIQMLHVVTRGPQGQIETMSREEYFRRNEIEVNVDAGMGRMSKRANRLTRPVNRGEYRPAADFKLGIIGQDDTFRTADFISPQDFGMTREQVDALSQSEQEKMIEAVWDGGGVISRRLVLSFEPPAGLNADEIAKFRHDQLNCHKFEFTLMTKDGQLKGHACVSDDPLPGDRDLITRSDFKSEIRMRDDSQNIIITLMPVHDHERLKIDIQTLVNVFEFYGEDDLKKFIDMDASEFMDSFVTGRIASGMSRFDATERVEDVRKWYVKEMIAIGADPRDFASMFHSLTGQWIKRNHYDDSGKFNVLLPGAAAGHVTPVSIARLAGWKKECAPDEAFYDDRFGFIVGDKAWGVAMSDSRPKPEWTTIAFKKGQLPELTHDEAMGGRTLTGPDGKTLLGSDGRPRGYVRLTDQWETSTEQERRWAINEIRFLYADRNLADENMPDWVHGQSSDETTDAYHSRQNAVSREQIANALRALDVHDRTTGLDSRRWQRVRSMDGERQVSKLYSMKNILGGGDDDDVLDGQIITDPATGRRHVLLWRNPNQEGEYAVVKLAPDSRVPETRVVPKTTYEREVHDAHKTEVWADSAERGAAKTKTDLIAERDQAAARLDALLAKTAAVSKPDAEAWAIAERHDALQRSAAYMNLHNRFHNGIDSGPDGERQGKPNPARLAIEKEMNAIRRDHGPTLETYRTFKEYRELMADLQVAQTLASAESPEHIRMYAKAEHDAIRDALSLPPELRERERIALHDIQNQLDHSLTASQLALHDDIRRRDQPLLERSPENVEAYHAAYLSGLSSPDRLTNRQAQMALRHSERNTDQAVALYATAQKGIQEDKTLIAGGNPPERYINAYMTALLEELRQTDETTRIISSGRAEQFYNDGQGTTLVQRLQARARARARQLPPDMRAEFQAQIEADPQSWYAQHVENPKAVEDYETLRRLESRAMIRGRVAHEGLRETLYEEASQMSAEDIVRPPSRTSASAMATSLEQRIRRASTELRDLTYQSRPEQQRETLRHEFLAGLDDDARLTPDEAKATLKHLGMQLSAHAMKQPAATSTQEAHDTWVNERIAIEGQMNRVHGLSVPEMDRRDDLAYFSDTAYTARLAALHEPSDTPAADLWKEKERDTHRARLQEEILQDRKTVERLHHFVPPTREQLGELRENAAKHIAQTEFYQNLTSQLRTTPLDSARTLSTWDTLLGQRAENKQPEAERDQRRAEIEALIEQPYQALEALDQKLATQSRSTQYRHAKERADLVADILNLQAEATVLSMSPHEARREQDYLRRDFSLNDRLTRLQALETETARYVKTGSAFSDILADLENRAHQSQDNAVRLEDRHNRLITTELRLNAYQQALSMDQVDVDLVDRRLARWGGAFTDDADQRIDQVGTARRRLDQYEQDTATVIRAPVRNLNTLPPRIDQTQTRFEYVSRDPVKKKGRTWKEAREAIYEIVRDSAGVLEQSINVDSARRGSQGPVSRDEDAIIRRHAANENLVDDAQKNYADMRPYKEGAQVAMAHMLDEGHRFARLSQKRLIRVPDEIWEQEGLEKTEPKFYGRVDGQAEHALDRVDEHRYEAIERVQKWNADMQLKAVPPIEIFGAVRDLEQREQQAIVAKLEADLREGRQKLAESQKYHDANPTKKTQEQIDRRRKSLEDTEKWLANRQYDSKTLKRVSSNETDLYGTYIDYNKATISQLGAAANTAYYQFTQNAKADRYRGIPASEAEIAEITAAKKNVTDIDKEVLKKRVREDRSPLTELELDTINVRMDDWLTDHCGTGAEPRPRGFEPTLTDYRRTLAMRIQNVTSVTETTEREIRAVRHEGLLREKLEKMERIRTRTVDRNPGASLVEIEKAVLKSDSRLAQKIDSAQQQLANQRASAFDEKDPRRTEEKSTRLALNDPTLIRSVAARYAIEDKSSLTPLEKQEHATRVQQWVAENPQKGVDEARLNRLLSLGKTEPADPQEAELYRRDHQEMITLRKETVKRMRREEIAAASLVSTYMRRREINDNETGDTRVVRDGWVWGMGRIDPLTQQEIPGNARHTMDALNRFVPSIGTLEQAREGIVARRDPGPRSQTRITANINASDLNIGRAQGLIKNKPYVLDSTPTGPDLTVEQTQEKIRDIKKTVDQEFNKKLYVWGNDQRPLIVRHEYVPNTYDTWAELAQHDAALRAVLPPEYEKHVVHGKPKGESAAWTRARNQMLDAAIEKLRQPAQKQEQAVEAPYQTPQKSGDWDRLAKDAEIQSYLDHARLEKLGERPPKKSEGHDEWVQARNELIQDALGKRRAALDRKGTDWQRKYMDRRKVAYVMGDEDWETVKKNPEAWKDQEAYVTRGTRLGPVNADNEQNILPDHEDYVQMRVGFANGITEMNLILLKEHELSKEELAHIDEITTRYYEKEFGNIEDLINE